MGPIETSAAMQRSNPFKFNFVKQLSRPKDLEGIGPCVVMATPSMLQSGLSRELFEAWCQDPKNAVIIADFAVQGTLAREILASPEYIMTRGGARVRFPSQMGLLRETESLHTVILDSSHTLCGVASDASFPRMHPTATNVASPAPSLRPCLGLSIKSLLPVTLNFAQRFTCRERLGRKHQSHKI